MAEPSEQEELRERVRFLETLLTLVINAKIDPRKLRSFENRLEDINVARLGEHWNAGFLEKAVSDELAYLGLRNAAIDRDRAKVADALELVAEFLAEAEAAGIAATAKIKRIVPISLFIGDESTEVVAPLENAIDKLIKGLGFSLFLRSAPERGSWFRRLFARTKERLSQQDVTDRLKKLERAMEIKGLDGPQAEADLKLAKAAREVAKAFEKIENGAALIGSLCVVKTGKQMAVANLTQEQLAKIHQHPDWLKNPKVLRDAIFCEVETPPIAIQHSSTPHRPQIKHDPGELGNKE